MIVSRQPSACVGGTASLPKVSTHLRPCNGKEFRALGEASCASLRSGTRP